MSKLEKTTVPFFTEIKQLIADARQRVAYTVNAELALLYWQIGKRINEEVLKDKRADYGKQIVAALSAQLKAEYGSGWTEKQLRHCLRAAETFTHHQIVSAVQRQLSWTHIKTIMYLKDALQREFYMEMCALEKWSSRQLQERIQSMLYERTAISKKPELTIQQDLSSLKNDQKISPDMVFRDPYVLDFLGLKDTYSEKDLETAIVAELQRFIIELGSDFAFLSRQKRITIDHRDYKIDLLFYHRRLKCLVAIDLKLGEFEAGFKGQMELYLRYLEKHEMMEGENQPIGLILCAGKNEEHIELLQLDKSNIRVAEYLTALPEKALLQQKLHQAIEIARSRLLNAQNNKDE
jgi:predicted nuclease of restriction endonuclease-like (RecB) superfamily